MDSLVFVRVAVDVRQPFCNCIAYLQGGSLIGFCSGVTCAGTMAVYQCSSNEKPVGALVVAFLPICRCPWMRSLQGCVRAGA